MTTVRRRPIVLALLLGVVAATALLAQDTPLSAHDVGTITDNQIERLNLQHHLDYGAPLYNATFIGTHNSYSAFHELNLFFLNHHADMETQLDAGARLLNYDLHAKGTGKARRVALCHTLFIECPANNLDFDTALSELATWLDKPENEDEVVMIVFQLFILTDSIFKKAVADIDDKIGDKVYAPKDYSGADKTCRELPTRYLSKQDIRDAGKNVLLVNPKCQKDGETWRDWVWTSPAVTPELPSTHELPRSKDQWGSVPEDRLFNKTDTSKDKVFSSSEVNEFLENGAALIGLDYFVRDNRHEGAIWSWDPDEPSNSNGDEDCATQNSDGGWSAVPCNSDDYKFAFACQSTADLGWQITAAGTWGEGASECADLDSGQYIFSVPINANLNVELKDARGGNNDPVWLNYTDQEVEGEWKVIDFVDVEHLPTSDTYDFDSSKSFRYFKIPEDTSFNRITLEVKGADGGDGRNTTKKGKPKEKKTTASGGEGAFVRATFAIGDGASDIPPGSFLGFVVGQRGADASIEGCCAKRATGGGGGGSVVLRFGPDPNNLDSDDASPWAPLVVAGGGGGAYNNTGHDVDDGSDASTDFVSRDDTAGGSSGASGGGGGAEGDGGGNKTGGKAGGRTFYGGLATGSGGAQKGNRSGGLGYGGGGASGDGNINGGGGGGGHRGGDGGSNGEGGDAGRSYAHSIRGSSGGGTAPDVQDGRISFRLFTVTAPRPPISVSLSPTERSVGPGGGVVRFSVGLNNRNIRFGACASYSGGPPGSTASFSRRCHDFGLKVDMFVTVPGSAPAGTFPFTVTASGCTGIFSCGTTRQATVRGTITKTPPPDAETLGLGLFSVDPAQLTAGIPSTFQFLILVRNHEFDTLPIPADVSLTGTVPSDCTLTIAPGTQSVVLLPFSAATPVVADAEITCSQPGDHDFEFTATAVLSDPTVDPDTSNNSKPLSETRSLNGPPTCSDANISIGEDSGVTSHDLGGQCTDPNGDKVDIQIVALSLASVDPVNVTGGLPFTLSAGSIDLRPALNFNGSAGSFRFRARDPEGATSETATGSVTVAPVNDRPQVSPPAPIILDEGDSTTIGLDPLVSDLETLDSQISWSGSSNDSNVTVSINLSTRMATINGIDDANATVTLTASDRGDPNGCTGGSPGCSGPLSASVNIPVTVKNVAPVVTVVGDSILENGTAKVSGTITDPGTLDTFKVDIAWGDGSPNTTLNLLVGKRSFSATHQYLDDNPTATLSDAYKVTVTVADDDGGTVAYVNPAGTSGNQTFNAALGMDFNVLKPITITHLGVFDSGSDGLTVPITARLFNRDNEGQIASIRFLAEAAGILIDGSRFLPLPTPLSLPVGFRGTIVAENYQAGEPNGNRPVRWTTDSGSGTVAFVGGGRFSPTSSQDVFPARVDGGPANRYAAGTFMFNGGVSTTVTVNNVAPVVTVVGESILENGTAKVSGTITDPGTQDTFTVDITWGPGEGATTLNLTAGSTTFSATHKYLDDNPTATLSDKYPIGVTVTDDDGGVGKAEGEVKVTNVVPVVDAGPDAQNFSGQIHAITARFTDDGVRDTHTATIDWGEGAGPESASVTQGAGSGTVSGSHQYFVPGTYTITVTVTDDDRGEGSSSAEKKVLRLPVSIDIKPGSDPNSINLGRKGVIPVGVFSGAYQAVAFDATTIIGSSLVFEGTGIAHRDYDIEDLDGAGALDSVSHYKSQETSLTDASTEGCLTGETSGGIFFTGCDSVRIVSPDKSNAGGKGNKK